MSALLLALLPGVSLGAEPRMPTPGGAVLPAAMHGTWFADDADGRRACGLHLRTRGAPTDDEWLHLVGAIVIAPKRVHHVSDHGEGNFYDVLQVLPRTDGTWRLRSRLGIDTYGDTDAEIVESELRLTARRLHWRDAGETADTRRAPFFRCSTSLPSGYDAWTAALRQARTPAVLNGQSSSRPVASSRSTGTRTP
ncbi:hypothetical protein [Lysobacter humi (ex Lee et al. 2017)]